MDEGIIKALGTRDSGAVDVALAWAEQPSATILTLADSRYPQRLAELPDPPPLLYVRGDPVLLGEPQVAIVGSRNPTPAGSANARAFAAELAGCGLVVTSGLAIGIDGAAHQGALSTGTTIAVLGTGPDRIYPAAHRALAHAVAASGALVTELAPGSPALRHHFPQRNRIIAGLSLGTLVIEAAVDSGSLITARIAAELGREVFAVPGSIHNPLTRGCHGLIRDGAKLVESIRDLLEELAPLVKVDIHAVSAEAPMGPTPADPEYAALLAAIGDDPVATDEIIRRSGLPADSVASMLLMLELEGRIAPSPGGRYCKIGA